MSIIRTHLSWDMLLELLLNAMRMTGIFYYFLKSLYYAKSTVKLTP